MPTTLNQLWNERQTLTEKLQANDAAIGAMFGFGSMPATRTRGNGAAKPAATATRTGTRRPRSRNTGGGNTELQRVVTAAAQRQQGPFTPAGLIDRYPALKGTAPRVIGRILSTVPGATRQGKTGPWSYSAPAAREAA